MYYNRDDPVYHVVIKAINAGVEHGSLPGLSMHVLAKDTCFMAFLDLFYNVAQSQKNIIATYKVMEARTMHGYVVYNWVRINFSS